MVNLQKQTGSKEMGDPGIAQQRIQNNHSEDTQRATKEHRKTI